ncbi:4-hydroxy-tetrahydrodipicolinate synthase (plasmid) [Phenylobacterium sp. LH3H17]|uniref:4-hydroxy-tetrahydrodipicolinate synthase n=1 Tax=Phenylobacterium sp. LH3H17 TaxID=2903901 RepID=UPI0020C97AB3|nr:4-hydroxy-tetrahydrodipicolinate synthase [Phenylobacterium sp. LH3H17]UTP41714.1 4-hydroxy-tetrahydrodipicolinate synthase [Phenylobacterium sp. LH3H17]
MITPFLDGAIDTAAFKRLVASQLAQGARALLVGAQVAGEGATLTDRELDELVAIAAAAVAGSGARVIADASSNATAATLGRVRQAERAGADAALISVPWYNRPSQAGLLQHYQALIHGTELPLVIGLCPARACADLEPATLLTLTGYINVVAVIDASPDVSRITTLRQVCPGRVQVLAGQDLTALGALAHGASGVVSISANVEGRALAAMVAACQAGDWIEARRIHESLADLHGLLAADPVPAAAKRCLAERGLCSAEVRLPMTACAPKEETALKAVLRQIQSCRS